MEMKKRRLFRDVNERAISDREFCKRLTTNRKSYAEQELDKAVESGSKKKV